MIPSAGRCTKGPCRLPSTAGALVVARSNLGPLLCVCVFQGPNEVVDGLAGEAMMGHDGPMPAPELPPKIPPFRCSQHIAFPIGDMQHVVVDAGEVLHIGFGFKSEPYGIYNHPAIAELMAEIVADRLTRKQMAA